MSAAAIDILTRLLGEGAAFKPTSRAQSARLQETLMALGFIWVDGDMTASAHDACIKYGLYARSRTMSVLDAESTRQVSFSSVRDFLALDIENLLGASTQPLMRAFQHVAARQAALDAKLDRVLESLSPRKALDIKKDKGAQP